MILPGIFASQISGHLYSGPAGAFDALGSVTVGAGGASFIQFSAIPQTWTHLQLRIHGRSDLTSDLASPVLQFNGDTGSNYFAHQLFGDGSSPTATASTSGTYIAAPQIATDYLSSTIFGDSVVDILDYTNTNKNKTVRGLGGYDANGSGKIFLRSGAWNNTAAINSILITPYVTSNFKQYTNISLYGIR